MAEHGQVAGDLLLAVCAAPDSEHAQGFAALQQGDWHELLALARLTRTLPLAARALHRVQSSDAVPSDIAAGWRDELRQGAIRTLVQAQAIARTLGLLAKHGFNPVALKGLGLAMRDYPDPSLRPLRDLDLLLGTEEATRAQALLLGDSQYRRRGGAGYYGVEHSHQLPEIEHVESGLVIELHHRINASGWPGEAALLSLLRESCQPVRILGQEAMLPAPEANLLHLIEHASLHHLFANGPLLLSDLHFLAANRSIDWDRLRLHAERMKLGNALDLVMALAARLGARWVPPQFADADDISPAHLAAARQALLGGDERGRRLALQERLDLRAGRAARLRNAAGRLLHPDPHELARLSGHLPGERLRWLGYPRWLGEKGARFWQLLRDPLAREGGEAQAGMLNWLGQR